MDKPLRREIPRAPQRLVLSLLIGTVFHAVQDHRMPLFSIYRRPDWNGSGRRLFFTNGILHVKNYSAYLLTSTPMASAVSGFTTTALSRSTSTGTSETGVPASTFNVMSAVCVPRFV